MSQKESEAYDARVVGWERAGSYHTVFNDDGDKVGRFPTDYQAEMADRVVIEWNGDYYTIQGLTDDYDLDDAIAELEDLYGDQ